jgi:hypothetical protein
MRRAGIILLALGLAACGGPETEAPSTSTQRGVDRSVADIRAAEAAMQGPVVVSRSVGELTGKAAANPDAGPAKAPANAAAEPARGEAEALTGEPDAPTAEAEAEAPAAG